MRPNHSCSYRRSKFAERFICKFYPGGRDGKYRDKLSRSNLPNCRTSGSFGAGGKTVLVLDHKLRRSTSCPVWSSRTGLERRIVRGREL